MVENAVTNRFGTLPTLGIVRWIIGISIRSYCFNNDQIVCGVPNDSLLMVLCFKTVYYFYDSVEISRLVIPSPIERL